MLKVLSAVAAGLGLASATVSKNDAERFRAERMAEVERINSIPNLPWKAGFNARWVRFSSCSAPQFVALSIVLQHLHVLVSLILRCFILPKTARSAVGCR